MSMTYRTRRRLQRIGFVGLILLMVGMVAWLCWVIWLERYVVFTDDGATLDFDIVAEVSGGQLAAPPYAEETVPIFYNEGENAINTSTELAQISGFYIDNTMLSDASSVAGVRAQVAALPSGSAVMIDVKNIYGGFYYSSGLSDASYANVDTGAVDSLIKDLNSRNFYTIARLPAFCDRSYGLTHVSSGLALPQGYLWVDDNNCYWLDPTDSGTQSWLYLIVEELKDLGFDEVVFTHFYFPDGEKIVFNSDKTAAIQDAAAFLMKNSATGSFAVSFVAGQNGFSLPEGRARIYLENVSAKNAVSMAAQYNVADPAINLVFLANTNDTRFDSYSVIRPITLAETMNE